MSERPDGPALAGEEFVRPGGAGVDGSAQDLADLLGEQGIGLCRIDLYFRVLWANPRHVALHGWGSPAGVRCFEQVAELDRPCPGCLLKEVLCTGQRRSLRRQLVRAEGESVVHLAASPVHGPSRQLRSVLLSTVEMGGADSPERDEAEKMASLGVMAAGGVHELNNIIGGMSGLAELAMLYPEHRETTERALEVVTQNSQRAGAILTELVDYSRLPTRDFASFSFIEVVEQVLHLAGRNLELAGVRMVRRFDGSPTLQGNPWRVRLMLVNLMLDIAARIRRSSDLTIDIEDCFGSASCTRRNEDCARSGCVRLRLGYRSDRAAGTSAEPPGCLFARGPGGTRCGRHLLDAARRAVGEMKGELTMSENESSGGIEVTIPLEVKLRAKSLHRKTSEPGGKCRALVVDDEAVLCDLLSTILDEEGYEVMAVRSGRAAVELMRERPFDVVVLDVMMPGELGGPATLREIRKIAPRCRVVLMTGRPPDEEMKREFRKADAHVLKPFHRRQLIDCLRSIAV